MSKNDDYKCFYEFDDENKEIIFKRQDMPTPWLNYLTNGELFTMISQAGGNLSWYKSPEIWRIGRYNFYNLPVDVNGMTIYLREENGEFWSPTFVPARDKSVKRVSAHGLGYSRFECEKNGVKCALTCFIGEQNALVYSLRITSAEKKKISVFACQEMGLMEYLREVQWQCYCKSSNNITYNRENDILVYDYFIDAQARPDETPKVFFAANEKSKSFDGSRRSFIGNYRDLTNPLAVEEGRCFNSELYGGEAAFAMQFELELDGEREKTLNIFLGTAKDEAEAVKITEYLRKDETVAQSFKKTKEKWDERTSRFRVSLKDKDTERMVNEWNQLQAFVNFEVCREISFYATGTVRGVGVRDASQDVLANVLFDEQASKRKIKEIIAQQYNSGKTNHYYYPIEKKPPIVSDRSDNHLWFVFAVDEILKETGDFDFLNEEVPYYDGGKGTILEHMERSVEYAAKNRGEHGLPLMLGSDWNDMLYTVCKKGKGESVFVSQMLICCCKILKNIYSVIGKDFKRLDEIIEGQIKILNEFCWDGDRFIRAVTDEGLKLGAKKERCGAIWINSQSWAVISGCSSYEREKTAMQSVMKYLDCGYGLLKLYPPLKRNYPSAENELTFAQPGVGENGGVFSHANAWAIIALCALGNHEEAYKIYKETLPHNQVKRFGVEGYSTEPYAYASNVRGPMALNAGQGGVSWLTGTASWMMIALEQFIFGVKPRYDGLEISPCIPDEWESVSIQRKFRGTTYNITIDNRAKAGNKVKEIFVDGVKHCGIIKPAGKAEVSVSVVTGE